MGGAVSFSWVMFGFRTALHFFFFWISILFLSIITIWIDTGEDAEPFYHLAYGIMTLIKNNNLVSVKQQGLLEGKWCWCRPCLIYFLKGLSSIYALCPIAIHFSYFQLLDLKLWRHNSICSFPKTLWLLNQLHCLFFFFCLFGFLWTIVQTGKAALLT